MPGPPPAQMKRPPTEANSMQITNRERGSSVCGTPTHRDRGNSVGPTPRSSGQSPGAWIEGSPKRSPSVTSVSRVSTAFESSPTRSPSVSRITAAKRPAGQETPSSSTDAKAEQALRHAFKQLPDWVLADVLSSLPTTPSRASQQQPPRGSVTRRIQLSNGDYYCWQDESENSPAAAQATQTTTQRPRAPSDLEHTEAHKGDAPRVDRLPGSPPITASTSATSSPNVDQRPEAAHVNDSAANAVSSQLHT